MDAGTEELPEGWVSWTFEPLSPSARRTADELVFASGGMTRAVVAKRVLAMPAGSRLRTKFLTSAVRGGVRLLNRRDYESVLVGYAEDCELIHDDLLDSGPGGKKVGTVAIRRYFHDFDDAYASVTFRPVRLVDPGGSTLAGCLEVSVVGRSSGIETTVRQGFVWTFDGGLVRRHRVHREWPDAIAELRRIVAGGDARPA